MAKTLFWNDDDQGRRNTMLKLPAPPPEHPIQIRDESYAVKRLRVLQFIFTIAQQRIQESYLEQFSDRCDAISVHHGLGEDQYWRDGEVPAEWQTLDTEFEQRSRKILQDTLRDYFMHEIADKVSTGGSTEFIKIIRDVGIECSR